MLVLDKIKSPRDVKWLSDKELDALGDEIRKIIIETAAQNGGHLASNLGIVDTTIALHRVFSCPHDSLIFDVGHQAYAHKLLTGRAADFSSVRTFGGLSGFTNREESEYDTVTAGHGGTSLSTAVGLAAANRLSGSDGWVIALIGDGSFTNGMIYEALEQLNPQLKSDRLKLMIVLNDNEMSISRNVGGVSAYLSAIRISERYFNFKLRTKRLFSKIPLVGGGLVRMSIRIKDFLKRLVGAETIFESLGLEYIGPVDGNDVGKMISVFEEAKSADYPVIVHIKTKKGKGYSPAEEHPELYHSTGGFPLDNGEPCGKEEKPMPRTFTNEVSDILCSHAEVDKNLVAITAAMTDGCGLGEFSRRYPERFFDVGMTEEHAVTMAGGMSIGGLNPVVVMYSTFSQRVFDQLWHDVALQNGEKRRSHVVMMLSHAGLVPGDGVTHQGIYDISLFSPIKGVHIYSPDTFEWLRKTTDAAFGEDGVSVVRYPKSCEARYDVEFDDHGTWKSWRQARNGRNALVVTYGRVAEKVVSAAQAYNDTVHGVYSVTVAVLERICPLPDDEEFKNLAETADRVMFVEESLRRGGVGEMFAAARLSRNPVKICAIEDGFIPHGNTDELMTLAGLDADTLTRKMSEYFA